MQLFLCHVLDFVWERQVRTKRQHQQNVCISSYFISINANRVKVQP